MSIDDGGGPSSELAAIAAAFAEVVAALHHDDIVTVPPSRVVELAAGCMPRAQHVALDVEDDYQLRTVAVTSDVPARVTQIREQTRQGPALDVMDAHDVLVSHDLPADARWPVFGARVVEDTGIRSIASYRLGLRGGRRATLTFYSDWPYAFTDAGVATGAIFAAYAALTLSGELPGAQPVTAVRTADVQPEIDLAVGLLTKPRHTTARAATRMLRTAADQLHRALPAAQPGGHRPPPRPGAPGHGPSPSPGGAIDPC